MALLEPSLFTSLLREQRAQKCGAKAPLSAQSLSWSLSSHSHPMDRLLRLQGLIPYQTAFYVAVRARGFMLLLSRTFIPSFPVFLSSAQCQNNPQEQHRLQSQGTAAGAAPEPQPHCRDPLGSSPASCRDSLPCFAFPQHPLLSLSELCF